MDHYRLFIGGEVVEGTGGERVETIDPGTGSAFATAAVGTRADAQEAVASARRAFDSGVWSGLKPEARAEILYEFADLLLEEAGRLAEAEARDSGGLLRRTRGDVASGARLIRNFARYAVDSFPWIEEIRHTGNPFIPSRNYVRREPVGVCVGIVPWNFPFALANWKTTMALVTGNAMVLKPASDTPLSALIMGEVASRSRIPPGILNVIAGPGGEVGEALCAHPQVDKISFTGSTEVGRRIMTLGAETVKKVTLELGGKSANIVLEDADLELAVDGALLATFFHCGQVCESGTRLLLDDKIHDEFVERLVERAKTIRIGYQMDTRNRMGPVVSRRQRDAVEEYIRIGKEEGATLACGGERAKVAGYEEGFYLQPTIFTDVDNRMCIAQEEIFGPVLSVIRYKDEDQAVAIANDSIYGLGGGVWSQDIARAENIASRIRTGTTWINDYHVFSDFCPFGGYKQSGVGRELGHHGLAGYTEVKHVHVGATGKPEAHPIFRMLLDHPGAAPHFQYLGGTRIRSGAGEVSSLPAEVAELGKKRALVVTDKGLVKTGLHEQVLKALGGLACGLFDDVPQDSGLTTVDKAAEYARSLEADLVVSVGGGSVIDTGKMVCLLLANPGKAIEYIGVSLAASRPFHHIVIPTTAGTGSEVTSMAMVHHHAANRKVLYMDDRLQPVLGILDPLMTVTLPREITASTGMDALTHAIEAFISRRSNPVTDGLALHAARLAFENLPKVVENGKDLAARSAMQLAATMAGWAFNVAQIGLAHATAHALGARCQVPHGTGNGIMLPHVMRFVWESCIPKMALVATALGVPGGQEDAALAREAPEAVARLLESIGHPTRLRDIGVKKELLEECAKLARTDPAGFTSPRLARKLTEFIELYEAAW